MTASDTMEPAGAFADRDATPRGSRPCTDLVDLTAIAEMANTTPGTVRSWRYRHPDFPQPVQLAVGPVWQRPDVEAWLAGRKRK